MSRGTQLFASLFAGMVMLACGCELPHGPITWRPGEHFETLFHHDRQIAPGYDADDPASYQPCDCGAAGPCHPRRAHHLARHDVLTAGPQLNAPWPKYHPVPTKPVFEPRGLYEAGLTTDAEVSAMPIQQPAPIR
ncbi:MAG: hypothetical protein QM811_19530 [Pirellulales bacterium]